MSWNAEGGDGSWNNGGDAVEWDDGGDDKGVGDTNSVADFGGVKLGAATNGGDDVSGGGGDGDFKCRRQVLLPSHSSSLAADSQSSCGELGHMARLCPTAIASSGNDGKCFNCGEEGHNKANCTNPRVARPFTGECRICKQAGHPAAECPDKPPVKCFNCKEGGHNAKDCKNRRVFDTAGVEDLTADEAWSKLVEADSAEDLDDFRVAFKVYSKAASEATYDELERAFRLNNFNIYLIATEKELPKTQTFVNLQGELDKTYQVGFHLSDKPRRANQEAAWPSSAEENLERLKDAGLPMDRGIPKCNRCDELGHTARECLEDGLDASDRVQVKCVNCDEVGHRARDCPTPRVDRFACRNCKQSGHQSSECTEPRSAEGIECRKCNEMGHFSKDCPTGGGNACRNCGEEGHHSKECEKPRNPDTVTCRNCETLGHFSKDCPKPRDYSKIQCSNCKEMGHTKVRCKAPPAEPEGGDEFGATAGHDDSGVPATSGGEEDWETAAPSGGDSWKAIPGAVGGW